MILVDISHYRLNKSWNNIFLTNSFLFEYISYTKFIIFLKKLFFFFIFTKGPVIELFFTKYVLIHLRFTNAAELILRVFNKYYAQ